PGSPEPDRAWKLNPRESRRQTSLEPAEQSPIQRNWLRRRNSWSVSAQSQRPHKIVTDVSYLGCVPFPVLRRMTFAIRVLIRTSKDRSCEPKAAEISARTLG